VDPPQLQIVCDALFDARDEKSQITLNSYEKLGGALKILSNYLDRVMQRFHSNDNDLAKNVLKTLVSEDKQRLLLEKKQVIGNIRNGVHTVPQIENIIAELAKSRLIRYRREDGKILIELTHDFLVDEILKWYSEEEILLRRVREIFETAYQNYQTHRLLMDEDILDLVLPVAEQFNLDASQTEFFCRSLLNRRKILPAWVLSQLTSTRQLLTDFLNSPDEDVRIATIESTALIEDDVLRHLLIQKAVWDESLHVRKVAGIILLQKYGEDAVHFLNDPKENGNAGTFRKAITLALIRDHQRELFRLHKLPVFLSLIILGGLAWVRLRRARFYILRQTIGGSLGAGFSGLLVGFSLGGILALYRELPAYESTTLILVLTSLGGIAGFLVGSGISLGMSTMRVISYRHHPYWTITGATLGGAVIGGILHLLGVDTFLALFGQKLSNIAGAYEGALVGLGLSLGAAAGNRYRNYSFWIPVLLAACGSMIAAILLTFIEGNLFSASIESIARSFANTQVKFDALAKLFGEANFGLVSRLILGAFEGFLFGGLTILGIEIFARQKWGDLFPDY
jgi:hypothetical protein